MRSVVFIRKILNAKSGQNKKKKVNTEKWERKIIGANFKIEFWLDRNDTASVVCYWEATQAVQVFYCKVCLLSSSTLNDRVWLYILNRSYLWIVYIKAKLWNHIMCYFIWVDRKKKRFVVGVMFPMIFELIRDILSKRSY